ncbi:MAG: hypothetical protein POG24_10815 [Acidocella sp.]|nr:hypothetical protein [Acidocella sp.]
MAHQFASTRKADVDTASCKAGPVGVRDDAAPGLFVQRWRDFLSGPPLPRGLAIVIITIISLLVWVSIGWLIHAALHH